MPKDASKNIDRYKISGGQLNEFEFQKNQEQLAEQEHPGLSRPLPGTPPEEKAQRLKQVIKKAHQLATKKAQKREAANPPTKKVQQRAKVKQPTKLAQKPVQVRGASAKKLAARKAAKNARKAVKK